MRNYKKHQQQALSRRRQAWNFLVDKLSNKSKSIGYGFHDAKLEDELEPVDLSKPIEWKKHKFMDGDSRQKLTKKAWKHADKE